MPQTHPLRIVLAKVGLDGHDRGIQIVARGLRDAGFHVIYAGLWQTPEAVVRTVADEDADWLGVSLLSGAHMTLVPRVLDLLRQAGLGHVGVIVVGIVPEADVARGLALENPDAYFLSSGGECFHNVTVTGGKQRNEGPLSLKRDRKSVV